MDALRVLIMDDELTARTYLAELLASLGGVEVVGAFGDPEAALAMAQEEGAFDVLFADVDMIGSGADTSGLDYARRIAQSPSRPRIVLATAHAEHAVAGFDLGAVDYLVKPWTKERLAVCLERLRSRPLEGPRSKVRIAARRGRDLRIIPVDDVLAFEASQRLSFVHTADGRYDIDLTLASLEASFAGRFLRVHRQWLVALRHVVEIQTAETGSQLQLGERLRVPVSAERAREIREAILAGTVGLRR